MTLILPLPFEGLPPIRKEPPSKEESTIAEGTGWYVEISSLLPLLLKEDGEARYLFESRIPFFKEAFDMFDVGVGEMRRSEHAGPHGHEGGSLNLDEFKLLLKATGNPLITDAEAEDYMTKIDTDGDGVLGFPEVVRFLSQSAESKSSKLLSAHVEGLNNLFALLDDNGSGYFTWIDVKRLLALFGLEKALTEEEITTAMLQAGAVTMGRSLTLRGDKICSIKMVLGYGQPCIHPVFIKFLTNVRTCREYFSIFDDDEGGTISVGELSNNLTQLFGRRPTQYEMKRLIESVDKDASGNIDFIEFLWMMNGPQKSRTAKATIASILGPIQEIHKIFELFCIDEPSFFAAREIGDAEFYKLLNCLGEEQFSREEVHQLVKENDLSGQGEVSFGEFTDMMVRKGPNRIKDVIETQIRQLKSLFALFDEDESEQVDVDELKRIVGRLGKLTTRAEMDRLITVLDNTNDKVVGLKEFIEMLAGSQTVTQRYVQQQVQEFRQAFKLFDPTGDGSCSQSEFRSVMALFGEGSVRDAGKLLSKLDTDGDASIDFVEFLGLMISSDLMIQQHLRTQLISFREVFNMFDVQKDGSITALEFHRALRALGMNVPEHQILKMVADNDVDGDGLLDFAEFVHLLSGAGKSATGGVFSQISDLRESFALYDTDGSGALDVVEIKEALGRLGEERSYEEVLEMMMKVMDEGDDYDADGDGEIEINFVQFVRMMSVDQQEECEITVNDVRGEKYEVLQEMLKDTLNLES